MTTTAYYLPDTTRDPVPFDLDPDRPQFGQIAARLGWSSTEMTVLSARAGYLARLVDDPGDVVMFVHDWGLSLPEFRVNWRAWALYGRSPIVGPAVVVPDSVNGNPGPWADGVQAAIEAPWGADEMTWVRDAMNGAWDGFKAFPEYHGRAATPTQTP